MNDILPKPFTKQGMLDMLEVPLPPYPLPNSHLCTFIQKHLTHLKIIQQMSRAIPRPPSTANQFDLTPYDDGRINPLAGMGLSDEQYNMILQNIVNGETFGGDVNGGGMKRELEDSSDDRNTKRSRFEVVE